MVWQITHACNSGTQEAEAGGFPYIWDQSGLHNKILSQNYNKTKPIRGDRKQESGCV